MFSEFRRAWREAVDNFWHELEPDGATEPQDRAAYREVARARSQVGKLSQEIDDCRQRLAHEREQVEACARRERMAREIGDAETARIAAEYRGRHQERADVLGRKLDALEAERDICRRDLGEMEKALQARRPDDTVRPELDDLNQHPQESEFRGLEDSDRDRAAAERLEELKRRMGR